MALIRSLCWMSSFWLFACTIDTTQDEVRQKDEETNASTVRPENAAGSSGQGGSTTMRAGANQTNSDVVK